MRIHLIARFSFIVVLIAAFPVSAQSEHYPTEAEIDALIEQMRQDLPEMMEMGYHLDRRTAEERQARDAFADAWSEVDPDIAPFLGEWFALDEGMVVFPTANTGEVCIIEFCGIPS
ncbi:MAG: hypothetical protein AAFQ89_07560 [Cyanobacteria bacterium J06626_18]